MLWGSSIPNLEKFWWLVSEMIFKGNTWKSWKCTHILQKTLSYLHVIMYHTTYLKSVVPLILEVRSRNENPRWLPGGHLGFQIGKKSVAHIHVIMHHPTMFENCGWTHIGDMNRTKKRWLPSGFHFRFDFGRNTWRWTSKCYHVSSHQVWKMQVHLLRRYGADKKIQDGCLVAMLDFKSAKKQRLHLNV